MDCHEFQQHIPDFIDRKLEIAQLKAFGEHAASCSECYEELEIYFATMTAVRQLETGVDTINDYPTELKNRLDSIQVLLRVRRNQDIRRVILLIVMMIGFLLLYR